MLTYVQGPAILKVFADIDNSPIAERKTFTLDGAKVTVFPGKKDGRLVAVALEHFGKGFGGDVGVMVGYDVNRDTLTGIGITTMKETPGLGTRVADPAFTGQFTGKPAGARLKSQGGDIDAGFRRDHFFHRRGDRARQRREGLCGAQAGNRQGLAVRGKLCSNSSRNSPRACGPSFPRSGWCSGCARPSP